MVIQRVIKTMQTTITGLLFEHFHTQSWLDPAKTQVIGLKLPLAFGKLNSQSALGDLDSDHLS